MEKEIWYKFPSGNIVPEYKMREYHEIIYQLCYTGEVKYDKWIRNVVEKLSIEELSSDEVRIEDLIGHSSTTYAVMLYRDRNHCTLREAKDAIDNIIGNIKQSEMI